MLFDRTDKLSIGLILAVLAACVLMVNGCSSLSSLLPTSTTTAPITAPAETPAITPPPAVIVPVTPTPPVTAIMPWQQTMMDDLITNERHVTGADTNPACAKYLAGIDVIKADIWAGNQAQAYADSNKLYFSMIPVLVPPPPIPTAGTATMPPPGKGMHMTDATPDLEPKAVPEVKLNPALHAPPAPAPDPPKVEAPKAAPVGLGPVPSAGAGGVPLAPPNPTKGN